MRGSSRENSKNAYILVYERATKDPIDLVISKENELSSIQKMLPLSGVSELKDVSKENPQKLQVDFYDVKKFVPERYYEVFLKQ